jgi:hypothetical protein
MLPAGDASLHAGRAATLERTVAACICPIAPQLLSILLVRVIVLQLFASRTAINIFLAEINEVLLAEATLGRMPEVIGLGSVTDCAQLHAQADGSTERGS